MRHSWDWKTFGTLEEILRGKGERGMYCLNCGKRHDGDYHEQCDKTPHPQCCDCAAPAAFIRHTQFAGSHPFCDTHAKAQDDFGDDDWEDLSGPQVASAG